MRKEEKPALFLFSLMQRYAFCAVLPKRAKLCHGLAKRGRQGEAKRVQGKKEMLNGKLRRGF